MSADRIEPRLFRLTLSTNEVHDVTIIQGVALPGGVAITPNSITITFDQAGIVTSLWPPK